MSEALVINKAEFFELLNSILGEQSEGLPTLVLQPVLRLILLARLFLSWLTREEKKDDSSVSVTPAGPDVLMGSVTGLRAGSLKVRGGFEDLQTAL